MAEIMIFGGTSEGRKLAEFCAEKKIRAKVSVVSGYGGKLLPFSPFIEIQEGILSREEIRFWMEEERPGLVVDSTHPYAVHVSEYIEESCRLLGIRRIRVVREEAEEDQEHMVITRSAEEAARYLSKQTGNILLTTGSKELSAFTAIPGYEDRLFVRVLPSLEAIGACEACSIKGKHIIAMQGPFSQEMNRAVMNQLAIRFLVTKEAGAAGGFKEKVNAAMELGVQIVLLSRPRQEAGISVEEAMEYLKSYSEARGAEGEKNKKNLEPQLKPDRNRPMRKIFLIGTGMGGPGQMTGQAISCIQASQAVFGAPRMRECLKYTEYAPIGKKAIWEYRPDRILSWLKIHKEIRQCAVLYSGDTGFYSGASGLLEHVRQEEREGGEAFSTEVVPGISTVSYMASRIQESWDGVTLLSSHGRECPLEENLDCLKRGGALFLLAGNEGQVNHLCLRLEQAERERGENYQITVGTNLSYPDERILRGRPGELAQKKFAPLAAMWIKRETEELEHKR
ncbi:precorrin-6A reductase [Lachnospiraceae bacterium 62-35]